MSENHQNNRQEYHNSLLDLKAHLGKPGIKSVVDFLEQQSLLLNKKLSTMLDKEALLRLNGASLFLTKVIADLNSVINER